jgi:addiction module HigA family antidote
MEREMRNIHPGVILKMELIESKKLTVIKVAELLGTAHVSMSNILNGHASITPNMALRLEKVFGGTARHFLNLQSNYDLLEAEKDFNKNPPKIKHYDFL